MQKKRKIAVTLLATVVVAALAACSQTDSSPGNSAVPSVDSTSSGEQNASSSGYPEAFTYWVTKGSTTLMNNSEMAMYKEMERLTGTKVKFEHPPTGQELDQFNLMMVSGKMPDVIFYDWINHFPDKAITENKILRLNELIEEHAPNLSKLYEERPYIKKAVMSAEGNMYVFPLIGDDPRLTVFNGPIVRQDWLDKLKLEVPTTIDEWEHVLTAFRDGDPNENGKADEIPLLYNIVNTEYSYAFMGAFGITSGFFKDQDTIKYGPFESAYKDFLTVMNRWYKNGLIDQDYVTVDGQLMDAKVTGSQVGAFVGWLGGNLGRYTNLMADKGTSFKLSGTPFPSLIQGGTSLANHDPIFYGQGAAISATAKDPEKIVKWLDYAYGEEGHLLYNFGIEGESYTIVDGKPTFTDLIMKNPRGLSIPEALAEYTVMGSQGPFEFNADGNEQYMTLAEQKEAQAQWSKADFSKLMPTLYMTIEEQTRFSAIMADLETYRQEMTNKFIMGVEALDKFEDYIKTLESMGIKEAIQIQQEAYNRYLK